MKSLDHDEEGVEPSEEVETTDESTPVFKEPAEEASPVETDIEDYSHYNSPLGFYKEVSTAQTELFKGGHYDKVKIAYIGTAWVVISGTDIAEIAESLGQAYQYEKIGRMTKMEANAYYFKYLLANGNMSRTQMALLAARFIVTSGVPATALVELHDDQLSNMNVSNALAILGNDEAIFNAMLLHGKVKFGGTTTSSLKTVNAYVQKVASKRKEDKKRLEMAAMEFIQTQASSGVPKEELAKVLHTIAGSLEA